MLDKQTVEIEKLKEAVQLERPIAWVKVHNLPDFVYFNHSQHVLSGRRVPAVPRPRRDTWTASSRSAPLTMGWCLDCHREHAVVPTSTLRARGDAPFVEQPKPASGLNCASCHY